MVLGSAPRAQIKKRYRQKRRKPTCRLPQEFYAGQGRPGRASCEIHSLPQSGYLPSVSSALQPDPAEAVEPHSRILDGLSANKGGGKHIVYICESCGRMFFRVSKVTQCPFCEQEHIRPAAEQEKQQFNASAK